MEVQLHDHSEVSCQVSILFQMISLKFERGIKTDASCEEIVGILLGIYSYKIM